MTAVTPLRTPSPTPVVKQQDPAGDVTVVKTADSSSGRPMHPPHPMGPITEEASVSDASSMRSSPDENHASSQSPASEEGPPHPNGHSLHKRKRSQDDVGGTSSPQTYDYSPPRRDEQPQHMADRALHVLDTSNPPQHYDHVNGSGEYRYPPSQIIPYPSNEPEERWDSHEANAANGMPPKRKRNFSNRTKTGCLTCRRRKKKCDEERPHCKSTQTNLVCCHY
jgi:hypothetical protein